MEIIKYWERIWRGCLDSAEENDDKDGSRKEEAPNMFTLKDFSCVDSLR